MQQKTFDKLQHPFLIKTLNKLGKEATFFNLVKGIYEKPRASIIHNDERLDTVPTRPNQDSLFLQHLFHTVLKILVRAAMQEKEKATKLERKKAISNHR